MVSASSAIWRAARLGVIAAAAVLVLGASAQPAQTGPGDSTTGTCDNATGTCDGTTGTSDRTTGTCDLTFGDTPVDFGDVVVGDASDKTITATNNGTGSCDRIGNAELSSDEAFAVAEDSCGVATLGPGSACTVRITLRPTAAGQVEAFVTVEGANGSATAELSGVGVDPDADVVTVPPPPPPPDPPRTPVPGPTTATTTPTATTAPTTAPTTTTATTDEPAPEPGVPIADRRPWWPVVLALVLVVVLMTVARAVRARRGPRWLRTHLRAVPRAGGAGDVEIVRAHAGLSAPTCVVRLEPRAERGTPTLLEVDR